MQFIGSQADTPEQKASQLDDSVKKATPKDCFGIQIVPD